VKSAKQDDGMTQSHADEWVARINNLASQSCVLKVLSYSLVEVMVGILQCVVATTMVSVAWRRRRRMP